jgi:SAM-dependent methyltransferase
MLPDLTQREVVDLGCGVGRLLPVLAGRAARVVGVDFAPGMVARARARARASNLSNVTVVQGSVADVPMPPESVDMVVCLGVFEHISATHRERALHEVARLLRPGGRLLLELNNAGSVLLAGSADDNPYRVGAQLSNGYFCELIEVSAVLNTAETAGFTVLDLTANPFFSAVRHNAAAGDGPHLAELYGHARGLDRALGRSTALRSLADQVIVLLEKQ